MEHHDVVKHPSHYQQFGVEAKAIVAAILNHPANKKLTHYEAYCMGCELKYRLRAGFKTNGANAHQDIEKAMECHRMRTETGDPIHKDIVNEMQNFFEGFGPNMIKEQAE